MYNHPPDDPDDTDQQHDSDARNATYPTELYTLDEFLAEEDMLDSIAEEIVVELKGTLEALQARSLSRSGPRIYVNRPREEAHQQLVRDYFCDNPLYRTKKFRRRFRMRRPLFLRIINALGEWSPYFTTRTDALNREGLSPLQKCPAAIRQLAYGTPADSLDEYLKIGETTVVDCLKNFVQGVIDFYAGDYLRSPNTDDTERLLCIGEGCGFPGMLGSLDCMHWRWDKCPMEWKGQFTSGYKGVPTLILEAVASQDLWIWHAFFGVAGSNNDINMLNQSTLFLEQLKGQAPRVNYNVNEKEYQLGYYLVDGIYPEWAAFVKSIPMSQTEKQRLFAKHQEGARKDVERAFGVLQARWCILRRPTRLYDRGDLHHIMLACIILHNMIVEDEK